MARGALGYRDRDSRSRPHAAWDAPESKLTPSPLRLLDARGARAPARAGTHLDLSYVLARLRIAVAVVPSRRPRGGRTSITISPATGFRIPIVPP
jgi:hypothetical protein